MFATKFLGITKFEGSPKIFGGTGAECLPVATVLIIDKRIAIEKSFVIRCRNE